MTDTASWIGDSRVGDWLRLLEERHLAVLRFSEVSRALRALSATYVERRDRLAQGSALNGGGKRAAFALCYGPLHFVIVGSIVSDLPPTLKRSRAIVSSNIRFQAE